MTLKELKELVEFIVLVVGIPIALVQLYLLIRQLKYSALQIKNQNDWNRKNVTFEYLDKYTKELSEINKRILKNLSLIKQNGKSISIEKLKKKLEDEKQRTEIMNLVSYFEHLAIGIENDYFDYNLAKTSLSVMAIETFKSLTPYFELRKQELGVEIATNFKRLVLQWQQENTPANNV